MIQFIFVIISIGFACGSIYINRLPLLDSAFHYSRVIELSKDLQFGKIPAFNLNSMVPYGDAIPTFYPWELLAVIAPVIHLIHNAVILWSTLIFVIMLLGLEVSYFSSKSFYHNRNIESVLFSIIYCISTITMASAITDCDIGDFLGIVFAPMVIFGWLSWLKNYKWKMMAMGLILMSFSHILDTAIIVVSLLFLMLFCFNLVKNKKAHILIFLKSISIWILSISIVWIPMSILFFYNNISIPFCPIIPNNLSTSVIPNSIAYLALPYLYKIWTFSDLVCLILSIIYWKYLKDIQKRFIYIAIFYICMNIKWIKIPLLLYTPLRNIQFMCRICFIDHLLLSIVFIDIIANILIKKWYIQNIISLLSVLLIMNIGSIFLSYALIKQSSYESNYVLVHDVKYHHKINKKNNAIIYNYYKANNYLYNKTIYIHCMNYGDYLPKPIAKKGYWLESGIDESNKNYIVRLKDNGVIKFYMGHNHQKLLMPMTMYNGQEYHLKLDGKYISSNKSFNKKMGLVELHNVHKGWHRIQLIIPTMNYRYVALATSIIGLGLLTFLPNKRRHKENDKK